MSIKMTAMAAVTSPAGTEKLLALDGTTSKTVTTAVMAAYSIDVLAAAASATPTTGDEIVAFRGGAEKTYDLDAVVTYCMSSTWDSAAEANPGVTGDMLLMERSNVRYRISLDTIKTYVTTGMQATVLNLSGLSSATLDATDVFLVCESTTGKKATLAELETKLWADYKTYVSGLTEVATAADSDLLYVIQSGTAKGLTLDDLAVYMSAEIITIGNVQTATLDGLDTYLAALSAVSSVGDADLLYCTQSGTAKKLDMATLAAYALSAAYELPWKEVSTSKYTLTPASTSQITMSDTSDFKLGYPVKYVYGGVAYYGIVSGLSANAQITITGAPLDTGADVTKLYAGPADGVTQIDLHIAGTYAASAQDILAAVGDRYLEWNKSKAYLVGFSATHKTADTGVAQPKLNVKVNNALVSTTDTNNGIQLSTAGTWVDNSAVAIATANYDINKGEAIEVRVTTAGTNGDAADLSVSLYFVHEG